MRGRMQVGIGLVVAVACLSGCWFAAGAAAGAASYTWVRGELKKSYPKDTETVQTAVLAVAKKDMEWAVYEETPSKVKAKMTDDTNVTVTIKHVGAEVTTVGVRVGTLGDRTVSELFLKKLSARLGFES